MTRSKCFRHAFVLTLLVSALAAGDAMARGGRGGDDDSGGDSGRSASGHSGGHADRGRSGDSGGSGGRSMSQGPSRGGSPARSFSGGGRSSGESSGRHQGPSVRSFSAPSGSTSESPKQLSRGNSESRSFSGRTMRSNSGSGQPDVSGATRQLNRGNDSGSRPFTPGRHIQSGGAPSADGTRGGDVSRSRDSNEQMRRDQIRAHLDRSRSGTDTGRVETGTGQGNGNRSGRGTWSGRGPGSSEQATDTGAASGGESGNQRTWTRRAQEGERKGPRGLEGPSFGRDAEDRDNDGRGGGREGHQDGDRGGSDAISGGRGGERGGRGDGGDWPGRDRDGRDDHERGDRSGDISGGRGGDRGDHGRGGDWSGRGGGPGPDWSRRHNADDFRRMADSVRRKWHDRDFDHDRDRPFHSDWWTHHRPSHHGGFYWDRYSHRHGHPYYWWTWASAPRISAWISFGWPRPYYWDYGPGEYIYVRNGVIYVNGVWYMPAREYYQRTYVLVQRVPDVPEEVEWLPLGVFALTPEGTDQSDLLLQLAVTDDGVIGGTLFNQATGASYAVEGIVEKQTQRAIWSYENAQGERIVMETGIYNFTKPDTTALVHFGPENMQIWQMVRLDQPEGAASAGPTSGSAVPQPILPAPN